MTYWQWIGDFLQYKKHFSTFLGAGKCPHMPMPADAHAYSPPYVRPRVAQSREAPVYHVWQLHEMKILILQLVFWTLAPSVECNPATIAVAVAGVNAVKRFLRINSCVAKLMG